jgi:hypothetical protein
VTGARQMEQLPRAHARAVCAPACCTAERAAPDSGADHTARRIETNGAGYVRADSIGAETQVPRAPESVV